MKAEDRLEDQERHDYKPIIYNYRSGLHDGDGNMVERHEPVWHIHLY